MKLTLIYCETNEQCYEMLDKNGSVASYFPVSNSLWLKRGNKLEYIDRIGEDELRGVCYMKKIERENPDIHQLYYIRGILRNRLGDYKRYLSVTVPMMTEAINKGVTVEELKKIAYKSPNWHVWNLEIEELLNG